jgi:sodium pump decarboxylase gamma subunit
MWTEPTMPFGQSVIVSLLGLSVVFLALICLALAIMVISKILRSVVSDGAKAPVAAQKAAPAVSDEADKELLAVLMATIGDDLGLPTDKFKILSVTEVK